MLLRRRMSRHPILITIDLVVSADNAVLRTGVPGSMRHASVLRVGVEELA